MPVTALPTTCTFQTIRPREGQMESGIARFDPADLPIKRGTIVCFAPSDRRYWQLATGKCGWPLERDVVEERDCKNTFEKVSPVVNSDPANPNNPIGGHEVSARPAQEVAVGGTLLVAEGDRAIEPDCSNAPVGTKITSENGGYGLATAGDEVLGTVTGQGTDPATGQKVLYIRMDDCASPDVFDPDAAAKVTG